ncbi:hypothetical protein [Streptomyces sp. NPDC088794]|uniref:hypothetical protein n=1 Tax=Streptomyces sp. NPDC088794 TaxID=3365902 RepID=UPI0037F174AC
MFEIVAAAAQFPTLLFTSASVVTLGFWLLVLLGRAHTHDFDADAPALARLFGEVPVAVAASVAAVSGWLASIAGTVVLDHADWTGLGSALVRVTLLALSVLAAWSVNHALAAPLARRHGRKHGPRQRDLESGEPFDPGSRSAPRLS